MKLNVVIMAGGRGERFWPRSRVKTPKQLISLTGKETMIQATVRRVLPLTEASRIFIVTGAEYADEIRSQLPEIPAEHTLVEPEGRNTAPCIGLAALFVEAADPDGVMAVLPSDHLVRDEADFQRIMRKGEEVALKTGGIVTLGIRPERPETGYGYIRMGEPVPELSDVHRVQCFTEKPHAEKAKEFLEDGGYLWNSGMFLWKVTTIRSLFKELMPDLHAGLETVKEAMGTAQYQETLKRIYAGLPKISIDYGILEKAPEVYVIPAEFGWDDLGSWSAIARLLPKDDRDNAAVGKFLGVESRNILAFSQDKLVAALGVEDLIIIATDDSVLVARKDREQEIREVLAEIRRKGWTEFL